MGGLHLHQSDLDVVHRLTLAVKAGVVLEFLRKRVRIKVKIEKRKKLCHLKVDKMQEVGDNDGGIEDHELLLHVGHVDLEDLSLAEFRYPL